LTRLPVRKAGHSPGGAGLQIFLKLQLLAPVELIFSAAARRRGFIKKIV